MDNLLATSNKEARRTGMSCWLLAPILQDNSLGRPSVLCELDHPQAPVHANPLIWQVTMLLVKPLLRSYHVDLAASIDLTGKV